MDDPGIIPGEVDAEKPANPEIQAMCDSVKPEFQEQSGINAAEYEAVSYKVKHDVAGTDYFVKLGLGDQRFCHLNIFKPVPDIEEIASLSGVQCGKTKEEPITYF